MILELFQVDSFTDKVFEGNPAAVCPLIEPLDARIMQAIALENNLSETAFIVREGAGYYIRWFTPTAEVDLCGHATLAAGFVLMEYLDRTDNVTFNSKSGRLGVTKKDGRYMLDFPSRPGRKVPCPDILKQAMGVTPVETYLARDLVAVLSSADLVAKLEPDIASLGEIEADGVLVTAESDDCDFVSRCFFPRLGVPEDPVTGSAHCTLAPYWAERLGKNALYCRQISKRGGKLWCEVKGDRIEIAGNCVLYMKGQIEI